MEPHFAHAGRFDAGRIQQQHPPVVITPRIQVGDTRHMLPSSMVRTSPDSGSP